MHVYAHVVCKRNQVVSLTEEETKTIYAKFYLSSVYAALRDMRALLLHIFAEIGVKFIFEYQTASIPY